MSLRVFISELVLGALVIASATGVYLVTMKSAKEAAAVAEPRPIYKRMPERMPETLLGDFLPQLRPAVTKGPLRVIAILDTGFNVGRLKQANVRMCVINNYNAITDTSEVGKDNHGHGTKMAYLAAYKAQYTNYCILGIKVFEEGGDEIEPFARALRHLARIRVDVVSMSFSGPGFRHTELELLKSLSNKGIVMFVASGNQRTDLGPICATYPACYTVNNLFAVGAIAVDDGRSKASYSNYANFIRVWYNGSAFGMTGTSVSTALIAGAYAASLNGKEQ